MKPIKTLENIRSLATADSAVGQREQWLTTIIALVIALMAIGVILVTGGIANETNRRVMIITEVLIGATLVFTYFSKVTLLGRLLVPVTTFAALTALISKGGIRDEAIVGYTAVLVVASLLLGKGGILLFSILTVTAVMYIGYLESVGLITSYLNAVEIQNAITISVILAATGLFLYVVIGRLERAVAVSRQNELEQIEANRELSALKQELEGRIERRTAQLNAVIEVGRAANASLDPNELMRRVVNLITDQFGYYYAAIFLIDASGYWAELKSATGAAGQILLQNRHRLEVSGKSMVGTAISTREARVALDVGAEAVRFNNPLLPATRSEIALPLIVGERVLGALDVQSTEEAAFGPQEIETLQGMASQVAIGLENARLYQESQQSLQELSSVYRQYLSTSWEKVAGRKQIEYQIGQQDSEQAKQAGQAINIPLALRETPIGNIMVESEADLTPEEISIIEAVASQAALALENARLLEETQQTAVRERTAAEITSKIWTATTVEAILQTAIRELGQTLNAIEGKIELRLE